MLGFVLATQRDTGEQEARPPSAEGTSTRPATGTRRTTSASSSTATDTSPTTKSATDPRSVTVDIPLELLVGAWEYFLRDPSPAVARRKMRDAKRAGFDSVILQLFWAPGQLRPAANEIAELRNAAVAADEEQIEPFVIVTHVGSRTTPRTPARRREFAAYAASLAKQVPKFRHFIVGNEPNLNRFWLPQFGPNGENVAARDYLALLAETYDALKAVSEDNQVIGGALAPRGGDRPGTGRDTHSPTQFIRDLGRYYRESGRDKPVMDAFAHHPYLDSSGTPPGTAHPDSTTIALADYEKLVKLLGEAFDGTAQRGSNVPIYYTEFGVQTQIPPAKRGVYTNYGSPAAGDAVPEATQARSYREAFALACKQPTVYGMFIFHVWDEPDLLGWQSGAYYADHTPKSSREALTDLPSCR